MLYAISTAHQFLDAVVDHLWSPSSPAVRIMLSNHNPPRSLLQSLSLPGPSRTSSSSSSTTASALAAARISACCSAFLNSVFLGSTKSAGLSLWLFRILHSNQHATIWTTLARLTWDHIPHQSKYPPPLSPPHHPPPGNYKTSQHSATPYPLLSSHVRQSLLLLGRG